MNQTTVAVDTATDTVASSAVTSSAGEAAMTALAERRRRRREALHDRTQWSENAHRNDRALWPESVANPGRIKVQ